MPIHFTAEPDRGYFVTTFIGRIADDEMLRGYRSFYRGGEWKPGFNELVDLSQADCSALTSQGLRKLVEEIRTFLEERGVERTRTAIFAPRDLPYGMARIYEAFSLDSPEEVFVFRDLDQARRWLAETPGANGSEGAE